MRCHCVSAFAMRQLTIGRSKTHLDLRVSTLRLRRSSSHARRADSSRPRGHRRRGTRRLYWFAGCQRLQLYHSDEGSPPLLTLSVLSTVKLGRPKLTVDNIRATLVTVDRPHLGRCHNIAVVDQQMSRQDALGCRLVPPHSLHPLLCSRDIYAVSDHLWRYPVLGRRLSHRPSKPNDLNRGFLWYKQSATQPVCFCLGITIPHTTASPIDCRRGSVEQQPV